MSRNICHCGHHRDTHFPDEEKVIHGGKHDGVKYTLMGNCLGLRCDCTVYWDEDIPKPKERPPRPANHPGTCKCFICKQWPTPIW